MVGTPSIRAFARFVGFCPPYRGWLADAAAARGCAIHAYVLMTNHVHLLVTPRRADSLPRTMQSLRHINATYRRTGTLWGDRYRAALIDSEVYFLACCRYIELNPVRPDWSRIRAIIRGRAMPPMRGERSIGWPIDTSCSTGSGLSPRRTAAATRPCRSGGRRSTRRIETPLFQGESAFRDRSELGKRCRNVGDRSEKDERIVF
jgi:hypothetical protein